MNKKKRQNKRKRKTSQKRKYGQSPVNRTPQVPEMLHDFVFGKEEVDEESEDNSQVDSEETRRSEYDYEYEAEYTNEYAAEVVDDEDSEAYDCRDHVDEMGKEDRKKCNKKIKEMFREEQKKLIKASRTYRMLKPALENPIIVTQALEKTKKTMALIEVRIDMSLYITL